MKVRARFQAPCVEIYLKVEWNIPQNFSYQSVIDYEKKQHEDPQ